jgi:hypothetical protein
MDTLQPLILPGVVEDVELEVDLTTERGGQLNE